MQFPRAGLRLAFLSDSRCPGANPLVNFRDPSLRFVFVPSADPRPTSPTRADGTTLHSATGFRNSQEDDR